jgi:hypothetical protein
MAEWDPGWVRSKGPGQDGRAELWVAVFTADWTLMGAAPAPPRPGLLWRDGRLCIDYSPVKVRIVRGGRYATGVICAVMPGARQYQPLWSVSLGPPGDLREGDDITVLDGVIAIIPDPPAPPPDSPPARPAVGPG